jgi:hypothetical protein
MWNTLLKNPKEIANIITNLNIKHSDVYKVSILLNNLKLGNIGQMKTIPVSEAEVINIIKSLNL